MTGFSHLAELLGIRSVVHDAVVNVRSTGVVVVHRTMVKWLFDNSTAGPVVISTRPAFLAAGGN